MQSDSDSWGERTHARKPERERELPRGGDGWGETSEAPARAEATRPSEAARKKSARLPATAWSRVDKDYEFDTWLNAPPKARAPPPKARPVKRTHNLRQFSANDLVGEPDAAQVLKAAKRKATTVNADHVRAEVLQAQPWSSPSQMSQMPLMPHMPGVWPTYAFPDMKALKSHVRLFVEPVTFPEASKSVSVRSYNAHDAEAPRYARFSFSARRMPHLSFRLDVGEPSFDCATEAALVVELEQAPAGSERWVAVPRNYAICVPEPHAYFQLPFSGGGRFSVQSRTPVRASLGASVSALVSESI